MATAKSAESKKVAPTRRGAIPEAQRSAGVMATSALLNAAAVIEPLQKNLAGKDASADGILMALDDKLTVLMAGDMAGVEAMLLSQATSLQSLYASLARRATSQEYLKQYQTYLTLALKAQAQSRATLQALIELKQPRHAATFVKQANIAHGHQQVNNGTGPEHSSHAEKPRTELNKLLEEATDERMDIGAQAAPGRCHKELEAVGAVNRTADRRG